MKETYQSFTVDKFLGLNSGPESSLEDGELRVLDNYLVTDEFKLERVPGNAILSAANSGNDKHYVYDPDTTTNSEMSNLRSHFRHVSGTKAMFCRYEKSVAVFDEGISTEGGESVDWRKLTLPATVRLDSRAGYTAWQSYQKNLYLAENGVVMYYDFSTDSFVDLNEENRTYFLSLGGLAENYTTIKFSDLVVHKNRLFAAVRGDLPNMVAFTQPFKNKFYDILGGVPKILFVSMGGTDEDSGDLGDTITRIIPMGDNVFVFKNNSLGMITGSGTMTYRAVGISSKVGLSAPGSLQVTRVGAIWLHNPQSGIYLSTGGLPQELSGSIRKEVSFIKGLDSVASGVWKEKYYFLSYQDARKSGGENNTTLVVNLSNGKWSKFDFGFRSFADWFTPDSPRYTIIKGDTVRVFGVGAKEKSNKDFSGGTNIIGKIKTKAFDAGVSKVKKRWRGASLSFRSTDKALTVRFDIDGRYKSERMVKTNPYPLWDRERWNNFRWADERLMEKEVAAPIFSKGFRMSIEIENGGVGQDYIESISPVFTDSQDSRGGKR
jgi:hypothetical protein